MMLEQLLPLVLIATGAVLAAVAAFQLVGGLVYDLRETQRRQQQDRHPHARQYRQRPLMTIIIPTHNDAQSIVECLESVVQSSYKKVEIIIADRASSDQTKGIVKEFIVTHPKRNIRLVAKRSLQTETVVTSEAYKRHGKGELVLVLSPTMQVAGHTLRHAVDHCNRQPEVMVVQPAMMVDTDYRLYGLLQKYLSLVWQRSLKARQLLKFQAIPKCAVWRYEAFRNPVGAKVHYANDIVMYTLPKSLRQVTKQEPTLRLWQACTITVVPIVLGYCLYLAVRLHQPTLLMLSWVVVAMWLALAIWDNPQLSWRQKLGYTVGIPLTYLPLFAVAALRLFSIGRIRISADQ